MAENPPKIIKDTRHIDGDAYEWPPQLVGELTKVAGLTIPEGEKVTILDSNEEIKE